MMSSSHNNTGGNHYNSDGIYFFTSSATTLAPAMPPSPTEVDDQRPSRSQSKTSSSLPPPPPSSYNNGTDAANPYRYNTEVSESLAISMLVCMAICVALLALAILCYGGDRPGDETEITGRVQAEIDRRRMEFIKRNLIVRQWVNRAGDDEVVKPTTPASTNADDDADRTANSSVIKDCVHSSCSNGGNSGDKSNLPFARQCPKTGDNNNNVVGNDDEGTSCHLPSSHQNSQVSIFSGDFVKPENDDDDVETASSHSMTSIDLVSAHDDDDDDGGGGTGYDTNVSRAGDKKGDKDDDDGTYYVDSDDGDDPASVCPICLGAFREGQNICESNNIACKHMFHEECLVLWLGRHEVRTHCPRVYSQRYCKILLTIF